MIDAPKRMTARYMLLGCGLKTVFTYTVIVLTLAYRGPRPENQ